MTEHYTRDTVMVSAWCQKCSKFTMHNVQGGRKGACQECLKRLETEKLKLPKAQVPTQTNLF
jgi:hypothetical protein